MQKGNFENEIAFFQITTRLLGTQSPVVWPPFPGLGGLFVKRDLNIRITS